MTNLPLPPLHIVVLLPALTGAITYFLPKRLYQIVMFIAACAVSFFALQIFIHVRWTGEIIQYVAGWPEGIAIKLRADMLSAPLVLLSAIFFAAVYLFSTRATYMERTFVFLFLLLESAILGVFLGGDLFNVYVLIELGMIIIAILIMYKQANQSVYDAMLYLMMNFIAMAFMLLGIAFLYRITGVLDLALIQERLAALEHPRSALTAYAMIMTAVAMKAALLPLFGWLPRAHGAPSAPAVVSAVLSGIQVKVGVYLLIRFEIMFSPLIDAQPFFLIVGFLTSIAGFLLAIAQKDIKLILAYHTISQVGLIVVGLNLGNSTAFWGGMYHIINHALFKGLLFLSAGVIIERYGTRYYNEIRGVLRRMPVIGIATLAGVFGIAGAPLFNGSVSKYFIQQALQGNPAELGLYLINFGTTLSFVKYSTILFGRPTGDVPIAGEQTSAKRRLERDPYITAISLLFGLAILAGGVFGGPAVLLFFGQEISASGALSFQKNTAFTLTLLLSILTYRYIVCRIDPVLAAVRRFKFTFNQVTVFLTLFFAALLVYGYIAMVA
ncbi:complex I subunit 5 family protein [Spirochaeta dissipatitropha]